MVTARRGNDGRLHVEVPADARPERGDVATTADEIGIELDALRVELVELRVDLARAVAERDAAMAIGEAKAAAVRELADRLTAELAVLRRPWWRKLIGR